MKVIENQKLDEERALYGTENIYVKSCSFDGPADGESALKECRNIEVDGCFFNLRYPFWHDRGLKIQHSEMTELCRAALWYSENVEITDSKLYGIKALRECRNVKMDGCEIISPEFGWFVRGIKMNRCKAESEYFMMRSKDLSFKDVVLKGKYSFQYISDAVFENCSFDTKDAFWHAKNVTVKNSVLKGEYLAWYSEDLTLINCKIIGTQPLCYCKNLTLIDCEMEDTDLCFEKSEVYADITTPVISIKNPYAGWIQLPEVKEIIMDDEKAKGKILAGKQAGEEFQKLLKENQEEAERVIGSEIPQLKIENVFRNSLMELAADMIGSIEEAARILEERYGLKVGIKKNTILFDLSCPRSELKENLQNLKQGLLSYEKFCVERC